MWICYLLTGVAVAAAAYCFEMQRRACRELADKLDRLDAELAHTIADVGSLDEDVAGIYNRLAANTRKGKSKAKK